MAECLIKRRYNDGDTPTIVSWQNGTDAEIAAMIAAADAGQIDLTDYWSVGDERTVHLDAMTAGDAFTTAMAAQDVVLVLMDTGSQSGYVDVNNKTVNFIVGQKDCLSEKGRMNTPNTNAGSWNSCAMRTDLNSKYYNALPATFRDCLKQFKTVTATEYNASTVTTSNDYVALFAEKEIFGYDQYARSNNTELAALVQIDYYKTAANRKKKYASSNDFWWERSPYKSNANSFCLVHSGGITSYGGAASAEGIAPFMCI